MKKSFPKWLTYIAFSSLLLIFTLASSFANGDGKDQKMKLTEVLSKLTKKYQVYFTYDKSLVDHVNVDYSNSGQSFDAELSSALSQTDIKFRVFDSRFVILYKNDAAGVESLKKMVEQFNLIISEQSSIPKPAKNDNILNLLNARITPAKAAIVADYKIKGKVLSENGEPLPGASVIEKGVSNGTTTDQNGEFQLNVVGQSSILTFSFVGYVSKDVAVNNQTSFAITLLPNTDLLETVVITGYSSQKKSTIAGAVTTIEPAVLENRPITSLAKGLQGAGAGFQVTRQSGRPGDERLSFNIRGATSISNVPPLVILDGVTTDTEVLQTLNPTDVESFTILKDASAAAIYGSKAAGGVILITTRKGKSGKARISVDAYKSLQWIRNKPQLADVGDQLIYKRDSEINSAGGDPTGALFAKWQNRIDLSNKGVEFASTNPNSPVYDIFMVKKKAEDFALRKTMPQQNYNVSASGGSENMSYYTSLAYYDRMGMLVKDLDGERRVNGRLNLNARISKHITFDAKTGYSNYKAWNPGGGSDTGDWDLFYGIFKEDYTEWPHYDAFGNPSSGRVTSKIFGRSFEKSNNNNFDGAFSLSIGNFIDGLLIKGVIGQTYRSRRLQGYNAPFQTYDRSGKTAPVPYDISNQKPSYYTRQGINYISDNQALITYDKTLAEKHNISLLAGYQYNRNYWDQTSLLANNLISSTIPSITFFGPNTQPGVDNSVIDTDVNNSYRNAEATSSFFGHLNYMFDKRYVLSLTIRRDASSKLAPGNRKSVFPSVAAAWNMHEEKWFSKISNVVNSLKLRSSWGILGGSYTIGPYDWAQAYNRSVNGVPLIGERPNDYYSEGAIPSTSLGWENIETSNIGIDAGFFNNKLTFTGEYYWKTNRDMFVNQNIPQLLGTTAPKINAGELRAKGWELTVRYQSKIGRDLNVDARFNIFDTRNKLISLNQNYGVQSGEVSTLIGYPLRTIWGYEADGYFDSQEELKAGPQTGVLDSQGSPRFTNNNLGIGDVKYKDLNGDGVINTGAGTIENHGDLKNFGTSDPRFQFGANLGLNYKQFDLSIFVQGVFKRKFMPDPFIYGTDIGWVLKEKVTLDYYTPENKNALYPRPYNDGGWNFVASNKWIMNGAYARFKNVQFGYSLNSKLIKKLHISRFRVYVSGEDVLTISKLGPFKKMLDPEYRNNGRFTYPLFATASAGLNIIF